MSTTVFGPNRKVGVQIIAISVSHYVTNAKICILHLAQSTAILKCSLTEPQTLIQGVSLYDSILLTCTVFLK